MESIAKVVHFVVFVNSKSGNGDGKQFLELEYPELFIHYQTLNEAHLYFLDLFSLDSRQRGIELIKEFLRNSTDFRVIICGGDGTIPWVLAEIFN